MVYHWPPAGSGLRFAFMGIRMPENAALYVDGFNLYHAINDLQKNYLKWLDLWPLGELIIPRQSQKLRKVVYCTAVKTTDHEKMLRHRQY